jgi:2-iminobutanoate/2-iminopropanoate deaminase
MIRPIETDDAPKPPAPFSQGIDAGQLVFVAGQLGKDPKTGDMPSEVIEETRVLMRNIGAVLAAADLEPSSVVKTLVFLVDFDDYDAMNTAYAEFFGSHKPARSTVKVAGLVGGARVEIEAIAVRTG